MKAIYKVKKPAIKVVVFKCEDPDWSAIENILIYQDAAIPEVKKALEAFYRLHAARNE